MKIVVLGAGGMVGSSLVKLCLDRGIEVIGVTRSEVDIRFLDQIRDCLDRTKPTHVINCAAYTDVDLAEEEKELAFAINAFGAENCAQASQERGVHLIHISTDYVFGSEDRCTPYVETDRCGPINVYGASKCEGERRVAAVHPHACIVRTSWVYS